MPIFKLSAPETVRLLSGHILPRNASNFTHIHLDLKNFSQGDTPDPCLQGQGREGRGWEGITVFVPLKEVQRERTGGRDGWEWKRRGGASGREDLAPRS